MKQMEEDKRISYIKKPMADQSYACLMYGGIGLVLFLIGMGIGIKSQGNIPLGGVAVCFSSLLFSAVGIRYGFVCFKEKEKNYLLARIGIGTSILLEILWLVIILIGIRG